MARATFVAPRDSTAAKPAQQVFTYMKATGISTAVSAAQHGCKKPQPGMSSYQQHGNSATRDADVGHGILLLCKLHFFFGPHALICQVHNM